MYNKNLPRRGEAKVSGVLEESWFRPWYSMGGISFQVETDESDVLNKKRSRHCQKKMEVRKGTAKIAPLLEEQFTTGRLYGK